ncbi:endonuclease/exonuclease/phosphatase family protein [Vibrio sp. SM6]|uniref:Endonuclease/exonuclease/phosphatase family protein n=2 Tax=Vibrio agarilyticus TaxID=2726741 RepID=A0A7X8TR86_9VIBR|nr:endonuclease/exonuclease/phosphatase family protein [Vibrio agarilyticus]
MSSALEPPRNRQNSLTIATMNLFNYLAPPNAFYDFINIYDNARWISKNQWITDTLAQLDADIIGFQEVFSIEALRSLTQSAGYAYFATVDLPSVTDDYLYHDPVVALASRYPIEHLCALVSPYPDIHFSRTPLKARISIPNIGALDVYVVHLKSQRPTELNQVFLIANDSANQTASTFQNAGRQTPKDEAVGRWLSTIQRGWETLLLNQTMMDFHQQSPAPAVLLGDFNQTLESAEMHPLCVSAPNGLGLCDAWQLAKTALAHHSDDRFTNENKIDESKAERPATFYHINQGKVLDYILLSDEFDATRADHIAYVNSVTVIDQHLVNPNFERDRDASDHAVVKTTLTIR